MASLQRRRQSNSFGRRPSDGFSAAADFGWRQSESISGACGAADFGRRHSDGAAVTSTLSAPAEYARRRSEPMQSNRYEAAPRSCWSAAVGETLNSAEPEHAKLLLADALQETFAMFAGDHSDMDNKAFKKLCKDCDLMDGRRMNAAVIELVFARVVPRTQRRMSLEQFEVALALLAARKGVGLASVHRAVAESGGPVMRGLRSEPVRLHGDGQQIGHRDSLNSASGQAALAALLENRDLLDPDWALRPATARDGSGMTTQIVSRSHNLDDGRPASKESCGSGSSGVAKSGCCTSRSEAPRLQTLVNKHLAVLVSTASSSKESAARPEKTGRLPPERDADRTWQEVYEDYCGQHDELDGKGFVKLCRECNLLDGDKFKVADADLLFIRLLPKGQRRMGLMQFEEALWQVAEKNGMEYGAILETVSRAQGPMFHAVAAQPMATAPVAGTPATARFRTAVQVVQAAAKFKAATAPIPASAVAQHGRAYAMGSCGDSELHENSDCALSGSVEMAVKSDSLNSAGRSVPEDVLSRGRLPQAMPRLLGSNWANGFLQGKKQGASCNRPGGGVTMSTCTVDRNDFSV